MPVKQDLIKSNFWGTQISATRQKKIFSKKMLNRDDLISTCSTTMEQRLKPYHIGENKSERQTKKTVCMKTDLEHASFYENSPRQLCCHYDHKCLKEGDAHWCIFCTKVNMCLS